MPKEYGQATARMLKFVACWEGNGPRAAQDAGYKNPEVQAYKLLKRPDIQRLIGKKEAAMAEETGKRLGKQLMVCRSDIINRLWSLAQLDPERTNKTITGQIRAAEALAEIFAIHTTRTKELEQQAAGKTREEMDYVMEHGYFPKEAPAVIEGEKQDV
jgi:phage terminase small subunit